MKKSEWLNLVNDNATKLRAIVAQFNANSVEQFMTGLLDNNYETLGLILQTTWEQAPDKAWIHEIPGWHVLCDLCSEYCFGGVE